MIENRSLLARLEQKLADIERQQLTRRRRLVSSPHATHMQVNGQPLLAFCSNDYLGLAADPRVVEALREGAARYGAGSGGSHLISGHSEAHALLEEQIASFMAPCIPSPRALYFSTGYMANLAVLSALGERDAVIFSEALNHASLIDGARLSRCVTHVYAHKDMQQLEDLLKASTADTKLVITDGMFSMDGDIAPLSQLLALCERFGAWLVVDDAHGWGVLGPHGRGVLEALALSSPHIVYIGTLGKAAGVAGAFVAAHATVIEWLVQKARTYIYTTAAPPAIAHALQTSLGLIAGAEGDRLRSRLSANISNFRSQLSLQRWQLRDSRTAIQPVIIADNAETVLAGTALLTEGLWVGAIRPPTVPTGTARLRITLSAAHTSEQIVQLTAAITRQESLLTHWADAP
jgi:8-amino-7-oxononanoate synthase